MSDLDAEFLAVLRTTFKAEAQEHLQAMGAALLELEKLAPEDAQTPALVESIFREAHSLKGAARAVGLTDIEGACQRIESVFALWKKGAWKPTPEKFDALHRCAEQLAKLAANDGPADAAQLAKLNSDIESLSGEALPRTPAKSAQPPSTEVLLPMHAAGGRPIGAESIRIATEKLDQLVLQAEEMLAVRQTATRRAAELREARRFFDQWKKQWNGFQQRLRGARPALLDARDDAGALEIFFDSSQRALLELEQKLTTLLKAAEQDAHTTGRMVGDLLEGSKKLLMTPLNNLFAALPLAVRELARDQGKEVALVMRGGELELDKRIIEEMKDAMLHLVRNAVDHGVEMPEVRVRAGKPRTATLTISVAQAEGSRVEIAVADDGAGIVADRVRMAAAKAGLLSADAARALPDAEAVQLIFASDVSTAPVITEISGRGLGLAIVREKAEKLGGHVAVQTQPGAGTMFSIRLPITLATFRGVMIRCAGQVFVLPTAGIGHVTRIRAADLRVSGGREGIEQAGQFLPCLRLADVLRAAPVAAVAEARSWDPAIVLGEGADRTAFIVDDVLGEEEVLVKRLSAPLLRVRHIAAATVLGSGRAAPILHVGDLLKSALRGVQPPRLAAPPPAPREKKRVLIVEDSITSRMLLKNIVESAGYAVRTAVDGQDALALLYKESFDLVMSDVDMPRMNGFSLTLKIRSDNKLAELPVVLITALGSAEDRARGIEVGANAYLVKSSFDQSNLLDAIRRLVGP